MSRESRGEIYMDWRKGRVERCFPPGVACKRLAKLPVQQRAMGTGVPLAGDCGTGSVTTPTDCRLGMAIYRRPKTAKEPVVDRQIAKQNPNLLQNAHLETLSPQEETTGHRLRMHCGVCVQPRVS